jgi:regulator of chromosome condensation
MPFPGNNLKRVKIYHESHNENTGGSVYVLGEGDMGQLGLGEDRLEAKKPIKVPNLPNNMIQVESGGVHSSKFLSIVTLNLLYLIFK